MLEEGEGGAVDHVEAAKWYRKAAESGDADSQVFLAYIMLRLRLLLDTCINVGLVFQETLLRLSNGSERLRLRSISFSKKEFNEINSRILEVYPSAK